MASKEDHIVAIKILLCIVAVPTVILGGTWLAYYVLNMTGLISYIAVLAMALLYWKILDEVTH